MEFEVRLVGGIDNCFVSLPLDLIQSLHFSSPSLPPVLALELRSSSTDHRWNVAWSGATSASQAIEVAQQFGGCISLPDRARVQVRAFSNVPKATLVTIEPSTEDDWEVRILHEEMRFPMWLNGRTTITFQVASTFPKKAVVYLWDITSATGGRDRSCSCSKETQDCQTTWNNVLITISSVRICCAKVITKREHENSGNDGLKTRSSSTPRESNSGNDRKDNCEAIVKDNREAIFAQQFGDCILLPDSSRVQVRALLNVPWATLVRILHEEMRFPFVVERPHYHYIPSCFNLPEESRGNKMFSLQSLQFVVVVPRLSPKESMKNSANDGLQTRSRSTPKESNGGSDRKDNREAIVGLLISDSVVKGHVMIQLYGI
ncbi:hypothetical protein DVH24_022082 [Malus domestica]|uniref:Uncharacterized protein n=1 Tax=Malus domestica TaxID=3750 RepID=A0A498IU31_MALDO|nr:hypothetical protein DVH24_022082 [Malus domestica]